MGPSRQPPDRRRWIDAAKAGPGLHALPLSALRPRSQLPYLTSADVAGLRLMPWRLVEVTESGLQVVLVVSLGGACGVRGAIVEETAESVRVDVYGTRPTRSLVVAIARHVVAAVGLAEPLGPRQLIGASTS